jgi:hypothetical protein
MMRRQVTSISERGSTVAGVTHISVVATNAMDANRCARHAQLKKHRQLPIEFVKCDGRHGVQRLHRSEFLEMCDAPLSAVTAEPVCFQHNAAESSMPMNHGHKQYIPVMPVKMISRKSPRRLNTLNDNQVHRFDRLYARRLARVDERRHRPCAIPREPLACHHEHMTARSVQLVNS